MFPLIGLWDTHNLLSENAKSLPVVFCTERITHNTLLMLVRRSINILLITLQNITHYFFFRPYFITKKQRIDTCSISYLLTSENKNTRGVRT